MEEAPSTHSSRTRDVGAEYLVVVLHKFCTSETKRRFELLEQRAMSLTLQKINCLNTMLVIYLSHLIPLKRA